ncbi:SDR family NAD(P)-dependent oxidoreductase [Paenibacillus thermotolerans]|uniref:SDR family NAD(P)-dependent oxidoreductase n=1 Tax=Paenibacillus thermotolerans TaxID=3027807 RepID=UPI0023677565|nr:MULTISPECIES: SDR family NAD(P)-dependent oxidoreductase [unclassified Paenibacillus]
MSAVYIVTGASRGLGEAIAEYLLTPGNRLFCISRTRNEALQQRAAAAGVGLDWFERDLEELAQGDAADALMRELLGGIAESGSTPALRLINNAGVLEPIGPAHRNDASAVARHIAVNLTAPIGLTSAFLRLTESLDADKRVMQISSGAGRKPYAGWSAYCAAKAGLDHFTRCVKLEQDALRCGAKVASVAPGVVDTAMQALIRSSGEEQFPTRARFVEMHESGALSSPGEAAERLIKFLEHSEFGEEPVADIRDFTQ